MKEEKAIMFKEVALAILGIAALWLITRGLWADCDPGIPSMWEYGYNATDEGYYLGGGKEKFVFGYFVDLARGEALNYGFSPGTHWLSYLAHRLFGLSTWAWRIPFYAINLFSLCALCGFVAKRIGGVWAFLSCGALSLSPMIVAYERTASNDVLIGSLLVLALVAACSRRRIAIVFAAILTASISLVKPSVYVLVPIVIAGILAVPKTKTRFRDVALYLGGTVLLIAAFKGLVLLSVLPDAAVNGCSAGEIIKRMTTHYPLPSIFAFNDHFRGLSSFPRDPSSVMLSYFSVLIVPLPLLFAAVNIAKRNFTPRILLYLAVPGYVAAIQVMNTLYTHYFIPVLAVMPLMWSWMREDLVEWSKDDEGKSDLKQLGLMVLISCFIAVVGYWLLAPVPLASQSAINAVQKAYSRIYNFPASIAWGHNFGSMASIAATVTALTAAFIPFRRWKTVLPCVAFAALAGGSVISAFLPAAELAPYMRKSSDSFMKHAVLSLCILSLTVIGCSAFSRWLSKRGIWFSLPIVFVMLGYALTPTWRQAAVELATLRTHHHREAAESLAKLLPKDAVVIGERSNQMLMSLPIRTATTFAFNSDPIPVVKAMIERNPEIPLYALVDTQHAYNLQHYREHAKEYSLEVVAKFSMPSFSEGKPSDVFLCRIVKL